MKSLFLIAFLFFTVLRAEMIGSYDKDFLLAYAKNHPKDIKSRELLLAYFYKKNNKKMIVKLSEELYVLDPKNKTLKVVVQNIYKKNLNKRILSKLSEFYEKKKYIEFLNLYQVLQDMNKSIPNIFHVNALYSAVEINDFKLAKAIIKRKDLPMTPHLSEVLRAVDKKLRSEKSL